MINKRRFSASWILPVVLSWAWPLTALGTPGIDEEAWYVVTMQDQKCGYMHMQTKKKGDEVITNVRMNMSISRASARITIDISQEYHETLDGRPLRFSASTTMGQAPMRFTGRINEGKMRLVTEQYGRKQEATYDFDPAVKFSWGQTLEQRKRGLKPGTKFRVKTYEPSLKPDEAFEMEFKVIGREKVDVLGTLRELHRVQATMVVGIPIVTDSWVDDEARPIITTMKLGPMEVKTYLSSKEDAMKFGAAPEMFWSTLIPVDRRIPEDATKAVLRLQLGPDSKLAMPEIPETAMQKTQKAGAKEATVTITRLDWERIREAEGKVDAERFREYLKASPIVDIEDKRIQRLSRRAVRHAETPADKADALRKFVGNYIEDKTMDVAFATASEVARSKQGDCSEHGVLLAALARAAGIPARGVSGIVQVPDTSREPMFGYHMWAQLYIGGQWVDVDGALNQTDCDPTHIALSLMPLNDEGMLDSATAILPLLGELKIEVVEVDE